MKTYFVLKDSHNNYWFKIQEYEYYVSSSTCDSKKKMIKCTTLKEAELEAIKIIEQNGTTDKVFIEIMIIDEEKNDCTQNTILCTKRMFLEICLTKVYK